MYVVNRNGNKEKWQFDKITSRLNSLAWDLNVIPELVTQKITASIRPDIKTSEIDELAAQTAAFMGLKHPDYATLAGRILVSNLHKEIPYTFSECVQMIEQYQEQEYTCQCDDSKRNISAKCIHCDKPWTISPFFSPEFLTCICTHKDIFDNAIDRQRDFDYDYFGMLTLLKAYLLSIGTDNNKKIMECPQYMLMRVAVALYLDDPDKAISTYKLLSNRKYIHASPTLFHAGQYHGQLASCFLLQIPEDALENIYDVVKQCAMISKHSGGVGVSIHKVRRNGACIKTSQGRSNGIIPMLRVFDATARYVDQGGGKRKGGFAVYVEPWHADIMEFLELRKNTGSEHERCRDIFTALWIPDLFMQRVAEDAMWSLFSEDTASGLWNVYGDEFKTLYEKYEVNGKAARTLPARTVWTAILESQKISGSPYMLYKDACNRKSNQKNLGTIQNSNLCVHGDTHILTKRGVILIQNLVDQQIQVWNGYEWSTTIVKKTSPRSSMMKICFSDGSFLVCTLQHKFYIRDAAIRRVSAFELCLGDELIPFKLPPPESFEKDTFIPKYDLYLHGVFSGSDDSEGVVLGNFKLVLNDRQRDIIPHLPINAYEKKEESSHQTVLRVNGLPAKFCIPLCLSLKDKLEWFAGFADMTGIQYQQQLHFVLTNDMILNHIRCMLQTMGVQSAVISVYLDKGTLPDEWHWDGNKRFSLSISNADVHELTLLGWKPRVLDISTFLIQHQKEKDSYSSPSLVYVTSITNNFTEGPTYCFKESQRGMGVFNGYLTGQCAEIVEYTSANEIAVCNLGSINYSAFVKHDTETKKPYFDFEELYSVAYQATVNLDRVIDLTYYPLHQAARSNYRHRPIGLGEMGLADVFQEMKYPYAGKDAKQLNRDIAETMYYACMNASADLAVISGPYETFEGSPISQGLFQFDLWGITPSKRYPWDELRAKIMKHGVRNSLVRASMPTASTSQIMAQNESFEPYTSNVYVRRTLAGEFIIMNKHLVKDLQARGLWNDYIIQQLKRNRGSVQDIKEIPAELKELYKTVWEIPLKDQIDMSADRGPYICQTQSFNVHMKNATHEALSKMHFYGWKKGLKTGMYYLRTNPATEATPVTVEPAQSAQANEVLVCSRESNCLSCQ